MIGYAQKSAPLTCVSVSGSSFRGLIGRTMANRPHRNFISPHTDGPPPLPATLLTLGLWLDGSIIVPAYASSPHKLPRSFCGLGGCRSFPWGSRGAPAVRLDMDRKYPICPILRGVLPRFLFQRTRGVCQPVKIHWFHSEFLRTDNTNSLQGEHGKGHAPVQAVDYATLNVRILVISLVSSLRFNSSSTYK
jgi:hypothetical protein